MIPRDGPDESKRGPQTRTFEHRDGADAGAKDRHGIAPPDDLGLSVQ